MTVRTELSSRTATVWLDDPHKRNAITAESAEELLDVLLGLEDDSAIAAVTLAGAGGHFCAGGDLGKMPPQSESAARERLEIYARLISGIRSCNLPIVCAVEGVAAGIGASLAIACDVIVAACDSRFLFPFSRLGLFPDGGMSRLLLERVGHARAKAILLLGDPVTGDTAAEMGLVDRLTEPGDAVRSAEAIAHSLAARAPLSLRSIKRAFSDGLPSLEHAFEIESEVQSKLYFTADFAAGREAFFAKKEPVFSGQ